MRYSHGGRFRSQPNGALISSKVTNWTFSDRYRAVEVPVSVARGVAPQRVVELLKSVAANHPSVAKEPAPQAYVVNFVSAHSSATPAAAPARMPFGPWSFLNKLLGTRESFIIHHSVYKA